jgi:hypothetical protein
VIKNYQLVNGLLDGKWLWQVVPHLSPQLRLVDTLLDARGQIRWIIYTEMESSFSMNDFFGHSTHVAADNGATGCKRLLNDKWRILPPDGRNN